MEYRSLGRREPNKSQPHYVLYVLSQQFGTRGRQEHNQMRIEDSNVSGTQRLVHEIEYIEWTEGLTKTRQGGLVNQNRRVPQKLFASNYCMEITETGYFQRQMSCNYRT